MEEKNEPVSIIDKPIDSQIEKKSSSFWELVRFILLALAIVVPIRMFVAQPFIVSGHSMDPSFNDSQYLIVDEISYHVGDPSRYDVIVFRPPLDESRFYIKRVIGLPGETVTTDGEKVTIKNAIHPDGFTLYEPYVKKHSNDQLKSYVLGEKEYFMMGDNRGASSDSRVWGLLPRKNIIGRALVRILPIADAGFFPGKFTPSEK